MIQKYNFSHFYVDPFTGDRYPFRYEDSTDVLIRRTINGKWLPYIVLDAIYDEFQFDRNASGVVIDKFGTVTNKGRQREPSIKVMRADGSLKVVITDIRVAMNMDEIDNTILNVAWYLNDRDYQHCLFLPWYLTSWADNPEYVNYMYNVSYYSIGYVYHGKSRQVINSFDTNNYIGLVTDNNLLKGNSVKDNLVNYFPRLANNDVGNDKQFNWVNGNLNVKRASSTFEIMNTLQTELTWDKIKNQVKDNSPITRSTWFSSKHCYINYRKSGAAEWHSNKTERGTLKYIIYANESNTIKTRVTPLSNGSIVKGTGSEPQFFKPIHKSIIPVKAFTGSNVIPNYIQFTLLAPNIKKNSNIYLYTNIGRYTLRYVRDISRTYPVRTTYIIVSDQIIIKDEYPSNILFYNITDADGNKLVDVLYSENAIDRNTFIRINNKIDNNYCKFINTTYPDLFLQFKSSVGYINPMIFSAISSNSTHSIGWRNDYGYAGGEWGSTRCGGATLRNDYYLINWACVIPPIKLKVQWNQYRKKKISSSCVNLMSNTMEPQHILINLVKLK